MAKFLQDTVEEMAVSADNQENQEETKAFFDFIEKVCLLCFVSYHRRFSQTAMRTVIPSFCLIRLYSNYQMASFI
jgi:hypothetical protein